MNRTLVAGALALLSALWPLRRPGRAPPACRGKDLTHLAGLAAARAKRADDLVNADGLLWRIDRRALRRPTSTARSIRPTTPLSPWRDARPSGSWGAKVVATELGGPLDAVEKANVGARRSGQRRSIATTTRSRACRQRTARTSKSWSPATGYPTEFAHHLKLWFLAILTAMPPCEAQRQAIGLPEVDQFLAETAKGFRRQGDRARNGRGADRRDFGDAAGDRRERCWPSPRASPVMSDDVYATMLRLYRESRPAEILPITDVVGGMSEGERAAEDEFVRLLLVGRNATMAERAAPLAEEGRRLHRRGRAASSGQGRPHRALPRAGYTVAKEW